jgi:hypothetical protein
MTATPNSEYLVLSSETGIRPPGMPGEIAIRQANGHPGTKYLY